MTKKFGRRIVKVGIPLRWSHNKESIIPTMLTCALQALKLGRLPHLCYQGSTKLPVGIAANKVISYHTTASHQEIRDGSRLNVKISPFYDWFTFDLKGFSGWADKPENSIVTDALGMDAVRLRGIRFMEETHEEKYSTPDLSEKLKTDKKLIYVEQLRDDAVAQLRQFEDSDVLKVLLGCGKRYGADSAIRPHPLSKKTEYELDTCLSVDLEIQAGSIFITHNSGFAASSASRGANVILLAPNEFGIPPVAKPKRSRGFALLRS